MMKEEGKIGALKLLIKNMMAKIVGGDGDDEMLDGDIAHESLESKKEEVEEHPEIASPGEGNDDELRQAVAMALGGKRPKSKAVTKVSFGFMGDAGKSDYPKMKMKMKK